MLDLIRLSPRPQYPPGGVDLCRQIAILTDMSEGNDVLDVACGQGAMIEYFVREHRVQGSGVDEDPELVQHANVRMRDAGLHGALQFQLAPLDNLPYRDEVFDISIGEMGLAADASPGAAVRELVRVTKPGGRIVLVQLVWLAQVERSRQEELVEHLGARPLMVVEWKRLLLDAGVRNLHTEDWSDEKAAFHPLVKKPFPDFAELFSVSERLGILKTAWRRWGWRGVRAAVAREQGVHRLLTRERILGLDLIKGVKVAEDEGASQLEPAPTESRVAVSEDTEPGEGSTDAGEAEGPPSSGEPAGESGSGDTDGTVADTSGLPLFQADEPR